MIKIDDDHHIDDYNRIVHTHCRDLENTPISTHPYFVSYSFHVIHYACRKCGRDLSYDAVDKFKFITGFGFVDNEISREELKKEKRGCACAAHKENYK